MKAITICQPHAHFIVTPAAKLPEGIEPKRVENRGWGTGYRGPLLIHAGKSRVWLNQWDGPRPADEDLVFGAIVGGARLVACIDGRLAVKRRAALLEEFHWVPDHQHANRAAYWFVLDRVYRLARPVPCRGRQGLFDVPRSVLADARWIPCDRISHEMSQ